MEPVRPHAVAILVAVSLLVAPKWCTAGSATVCGNGITEGDEECDDGGICIGGMNAGATCSAETDCDGGGVCVGGTNAETACAAAGDCPQGRCVRCRTFGGDGCAANCTLETTLPFYLRPGIDDGVQILPPTSGAVVNGENFTLPLPVTGRQSLIIGKDRGDGVPVVIPVASVESYPVVVQEIACGCVRSVAAKTCGGTLLEADGQTRSTDCTVDDSVCARQKPCAFLYGPDNSGSGTIDCQGTVFEHADVEVTQDHGPSGMPGEPVIRLIGPTSSGAALVLTTQSIGVVLGECAGTDPSLYGQDGIFCTGDDPPAARGVPLTALATTGTACATVFDANELNGFDIGPHCAMGQPFDCQVLSQGTTAGACLAAPATSLAVHTLGQPAIGDVAVTTQQCAQATPAATPTAPMPAPTATPTVPAAACIGDCHGDGMVTVDELLLGISIALGDTPADACLPSAFDCCGAACTQVPQLTIDCLMRAVSNALDGC